MRQIMQGPNSYASCLQVVGIGKSTHEGSHHLLGVHNGMARGLLLAKAMDHHGSLGDNYLILIVEKLDQLWDGSSC